MIIMNKITEQIRQFAKDKHESVNHNYGNYPYIKHLDQVTIIAYEFKHLIPSKDLDEVIGACYCHDLIEDTRLTYNDLKSELSKIIYEYGAELDTQAKYFYYKDCIHYSTIITDIVYALTNEKGRNRKERANEKYYQGIRNIKYAVFVKLCDRIANMIHSKSENNGQFSMYIKEHKYFKSQLFLEEYKEMFDYIEQIINE